MIKFETKIQGRGNRFYLKDTNFSFYHYYYFKTPLLHINIQKNASSSLKNFLDNAEILDQSKDKKKFWFTITRDPLDRFKSTMRMLKSYGIDFLGRCLYKFPDQSTNDFFIAFSHFVPQHLHVEWFEQRYDIKYFNIKNLVPLKLELEKFTVNQIPILTLNSTNRNKHDQEKIDKWINNNKNFVDDFLAPDYEWLAKIKSKIVD
jgi:hypothetical protein